MFNIFISRCSAEVSKAEWVSIVAFTEFFWFIVQINTSPVLPISNINDPNLFVNFLTFNRFLLNSPHPTDSSRFFFLCNIFNLVLFFCSPFLKEGTLLVSSPKGGKKTINSFVEETMNSCWGTLRNKQTCLFTCEFTPGNGGKVVSKSGLPVQKKQVHVTNRIFFNVSTTQICHSSPGYVFTRQPIPRCAAAPALPPPLHPPHPPPQERPTNN